MVIEEVSKHQETLSLVGLGEVSNLRGQANWEEKSIKPTDYMPKSNSQQESTPDTRIHHQQVGTERRGAGGIAQGKDRPECPEGNWRELT